MEERREEGLTNVRQNSFLPSFISYFLPHSFISLQDYSLHSFILYFFHHSFISLQDYSLPSFISYFLPHSFIHYSFQHPPSHTQTYKNSPHNSPNFPHNKFHSFPFFIKLTVSTLPFAFSLIKVV